MGPSLTAILISSSAAHQGADGLSHFMSDSSLFVTFWTAAAIMFLAFLLALYFMKAHAREYQEVEIAEAGT